MNAKFYYAEAYEPNFKVVRANLADAGAKEDIYVSATGSPRAIAIDSVNGVAYFSDWHSSVASIFQFNLIGTAIPTSYLTNVNSYGMALHISQGVKPGPPAVTRDDSENSVTGMAEGMEYNLDDAGYVAYDAASFAELDFSGNHILLVRVAAAGINPVSDEVSLSFTPNPSSTVSSVTASNGSISIVLNSVPTIGPTEEDFIATGSIDGAEAARLTLSDFVWDEETRNVSFEFEAVTQTTSKQSVIIAVSYNGGTAVEAPAFIVKGTTSDECFIATAAFGSKFQPAVKLLRQFRDDYLLTNRLGQAFVRFYYRNSPPIARFIAGSEGLKGLTRLLLSPFIAFVYLMYHPLLAMGCILIIILLGIYWRRRTSGARHLTC
jgi:hypothetical protein